MIRLGIIGLGATVAIANYHEKGLKKDGRIKISAVYDINGDVAKRWVEERNLDCIVAKDIDELFDNCDVVDICTPNFTHCDYIVKAIEKGKHIFVEKPSALSFEEAQIEVETLGDKNLVNMVGYIYRFPNAIKTLKKLVNDKIGKIYTYTTYYGGKRLADPNVMLEWRFIRKMSGSGAIADFGSHVVDLFSFVTGEKLQSVCAMKNTFIEKRPPNPMGQTEVENDDSCVFCGTSNSGTLFSATVSRVGMDDMRIVVAGEGGMASLTMRKSGEILFWEKEINGSYKGDAKVVKVEEQVFFDGWFDAEMKTFADVLLGKELNYPTLKDGLYVEKVLAAVEKSANENRVIKI